MSKPMSMGKQAAWAMAIFIAVNLTRTLWAVFTS